MQEYFLFAQYLFFVQIEPLVSEIISSIAAHYHVECAGWDFRLKEFQSAYEKVVVRQECDDIISMKDVIRYTFLVDADSFGTTVSKMLKEFAFFGVDTLVVKNFWLDASNPYNGINVQTKILGTAVEVQFHTADSLQVKEEKLHKLYEEYRKVAADSPNSLVAKKLNAEMMRLSSTQQRPAGVETIPCQGWTPKLLRTGD